MVNSCPGVGTSSGGSKGSREPNSNNVKDIKEESQINFVSEAEELSQYEEPSDYYNVSEPSDQNIPPIVLPIQLDNAVSAEGLIDPDSSCDLVSEKLVLKDLAHLKPSLIQSLSLLHHPLES